MKKAKQILAVLVIGGILAVGFHSISVKAQIDPPLPSSVKQTVSLAEPPK